MLRFNSLVRPSNSLGRNTSLNNIFKHNTMTASKSPFYIFARDFNLDETKNIKLVSTNCKIPLFVLESGFNPNNSLVTRSDTAIYNFIRNIKVSNVVIFVSGCMGLWFVKNIFEDLIKGFKTFN